MDDVIEFELLQGGIAVAAVSGPQASAIREILHYANIYGEDGPIEIRQVTRTVVSLQDLVSGRDFLTVMPDETLG